MNISNIFFYLNLLQIYYIILILKIIQKCEYLNYYFQIFKSMIL